MGTPGSLLICLSPFVRLLPQLPSLCVPRAGSSLPRRKHKQRHPHTGRSLPVPTYNCCATCRMQHVLSEAAKHQRLHSRQQAQPCREPGPGTLLCGTPTGLRAAAHLSLPHVLFRKQTNKHENTSAVSIPQKVKL